MASVSYAHIDFTTDGVPVIAGTSTKVEEVVLDYLAYRWDAEEIHRQHPHLSLAQIHSALAYYYDHQVEMEQAIEAGLREVRRIQMSLGESPLRAKLATQGRDW